MAFRTAWLITWSTADGGCRAGGVREGVLRARAVPGRGGVPPWILRIVSNEAKNRRRSAGRRERLALRVADERGPGDAAPSPETAAVELERRADLLAALERLERDRLVVAYRYLLELSEAETATALGVRPGTVKSRRLARALGGCAGSSPEGMTMAESTG